MEDYKVLAGCIENMDSLEEEGMESSDGTAESNNNIKTTTRSQYYMSSDKVEAASRAAAAVLAGGSGGSVETNSSSNKQDATTPQREFQRQHTEVHSNLSTTNSTESTAQQEQQHEAEQLLESTARGILDRNGSNESVVVSSPSVSREEERENASRSSLSHSNSPASFLLDVSSCYIHMDV